jgi:hypothetical protein
MLSYLLSDSTMELYSTDTAPLSTTALVGSEYKTENCRCRLGDVACLGWYEKGEKNDTVVISFFVYLHSFLKNMARYRQIYLAMPPFWNPVCTA